jgi:hypothetical protein
MWSFLQHVAIYDLEIENFASPRTDFIDLPEKDRDELLNDIGTNVFSEVTLRSEPEILIGQRQIRSKCRIYKLTAQASGSRRKSFTRLRFELVSDRKWRCPMN